MLNWQSLDCCVDAWRFYTTLPCCRRRRRCCSPCTAVPAAAAVGFGAYQPSGGVTTLTDDDEVSLGVRRESSFVETDYGDGLIELRTRRERAGAQPGIQKVRLSWATAFLRET